MHNKRIRVVCVLAAVIRIVCTSVSAGFALAETGYSSQTEREIQDLIDERSRLLTQLFQDQNKDAAVESIDAFNSIDLQLARKGVSFLSLSDVLKRFPEVKCGSYPSYHTRSTPAGYCDSRLAASLALSGAHSARHCCAGSC